MPERDVRLYLADIIEATRKIEGYTKGMDYRKFKADEKTFDAVLRNLEVIGEAVKNIPEEMKRKYPHVEWKYAARMRDRLIHEYFGVSVRIVWETVTNDLPAFKASIEKVLKDVAKS
jgi:uncharacterized protein with HEPN domain